MCGKGHTAAWCIHTYTTLYIGLFFFWLSRCFLSPCRLVFLFWLLLVVWLSLDICLLFFACCYRALQSCLLIICSIPDANLHWNQSVIFFSLVLRHYLLHRYGSRCGLFLPLSFSFSWDIQTHVLVQECSCDRYTCVWTWLVCHFQFLCDRASDWVPTLPVLTHLGRLRANRHQVQRSQILTAVTLVAVAKQSTPSYMYFSNVP